LTLVPESWHVTVLALIYVSAAFSFSKTSSFSIAT
jgi:hypothetical protein